MAGGITRISNSLRSYTLLNDINRNNLLLFRHERRLASGKNLLSVSDDALVAEKIARLKKTLQGQDQVLENIRHADGQLAASDNAMTDAHALLIDAARIASEQAGTVQSAEERAAQAAVVNEVINQMMSIGNRQFAGLYLFGGQQVEAPPFNDALGRVTWAGDAGARRTLVDFQTASRFNVHAAEAFRLTSNPAGGYANWDVALSDDTRLTDLRGSSGSGVFFGPMRITEAGVTFDVTVTSTMTAGDLVAEFNGVAAAAGSTLTMSLEGNHFRIDSGGGNPFFVGNIGSGRIASDLGIFGNSTGATLTGVSVQRRARAQTLLSDINGGLALPNGVFLDNSGRSTAVSFTGATTVGDVINALTQSGVGIRAEINDLGNGIRVHNLIAGSELRIAENGGTDADVLGIKTNPPSVALSTLNGGRGLHPIEGNDIRITDADGVSFEVDLNGALTLGDVISRINAASAAAGASITAAPSPNGAGLRLTGAAGPGSIVVEAVNLSPAASELGILKTGTATVLDGDHVFSTRQSGVFSALYRLRDALLTNDTVGITVAGSEINAMQSHMASQQGQAGARSAAMRTRLDQTETAVIATQSLLSQLEDVDLTEAITSFQRAQAALQASLLTGAQSRNLSLLDYLR